MTKTSRVERLYVLLVLLVLLLCEMVLANEKSSKVESNANNVDDAVEVSIVPRGSWSICSFGKCGRRRTKGRKRFQPINAQFANDGDDFQISDTNNRDLRRMESSNNEKRHNYREA